MIAKMSKVEIIGPQRYFDSVLHLLQGIGELHFEEVPLGESEGKFLLHRIHITEPLEKEKASLENLLKMLEDLSRLGGVDEEQVHPSTPDTTEKETFYDIPLEKIFFRVNRLKNRLKSLVRRRLNIEDDLAVAKRYDKLVKRFYPVICSESDKKADCEYIGITIPTKDKKTLGSLREKLGQVVAAEYRLFSHDFDDEQTVALLAFEKNHANSVKDLLWHEGISELRVPSEFESMPLDATFEMLHKKLIDLPADLEEIQGELERLISENRSFLWGVRDLCLNRLEHFKVFSKVAVTKFTFIINAWIPSRSTESSAWIPAKSVDEVRSLLERTFEGVVLVNELGLDGVESVEIPIKLDNKPIVRPFELLLNFFPPPKYGTVDPTSMVALFFPL
ncbi:MAG: hypothetical protein GY801_33405, partial [bacterium]|nr:hypothetical protein [bacterium]